VHGEGSAEKGKKTKNVLPGRWEEMETLRSVGGRKILVEMYNGVL